MYEIIALARKDLTLLFRDKAGFFFTFFFPLIYAVFFGVIMASFQDGPARGIHLVVVDEDSTAGSRKFTGSLNESTAVRVYKPGTKEGDTAPQAPTREQAVDLVRRGDCAAYIVLLPGFGDAMERAMWGPAPKIEIGTDPSRKAESGMLQGVLTELAARRFQTAFTNPDSMRKQLRASIESLRSDESDDMDPATRGGLQAFLPALDLFLGVLPATTQSASDHSSDGFGGFTPLEIVAAPVSRKWDGPKNTYEITFPQAVIWAVMGCAAAFGISLVVERTAGTIVRLRMAPFARWKILAGKATACFVTTLCVASFLLAAAILVFRVRPDSPALLAVALLCVALCFVGIMMLLSVLGKTEQSAGGIGWAVLLVMAMIGGGMMPLFAMPEFMQTVSHFSPIKWSIVAMEGGIWRGYSAAEMVRPCGILIGIGALCFLIGVRAFQWTDRGA